MAFHDPRLDRVTDRPAPSRSSTLPRSRRPTPDTLVAGRRGTFPFRDTGVRVPRLAGCWTGFRTRA